jgi:catechol 2,3-dioxygenase-like lactoylglutathione lyase family enzyme
MIEGLSHLTFIVSDLDRMSTLLGTVFNAREVYSSGEQTFSLSREKFFLIGDLWIAVMEGEPLPTRTYNHTAFKVPEADLPLYRDRLSSLGLELRESRPRVSGEGFSLYFYDHDNHLFELHTGTLSDRLARYADRHEAAA